MVNANEEVVEDEVEEKSCQADSKWDSWSIDGRKSWGDNLHTGVGNQAKGVAFES